MRSLPVCDEFISVPAPPSLKAGLRRLAQRDCSTLAATARRLLARGIAHELAQLAPSGPLPARGIG